MMLGFCPNFNFNLLMLIFFVNLLVKCCFMGRNGFEGPCHFASAPNSMQEMLLHAPYVSISHIRREANGLADFLAKRGSSQEVALCAWL